MLYSSIRANLVAANSFPQLLANARVLGNVGTVSDLQASDAMTRTPLDSTARTWSRLRSDVPPGLCLTLDDARAVLEHWQAADQRLGFSFFRASDALVRAGQATVAHVGADTLTLDAGDLRFAVPIGNACIEFTQAEVYRRGYETIDAEGLSVFLVNGDWLFLFQETSRRPRGRGRCGARRQVIAAGAAREAKIRRHT